MAIGPRSRERARVASGPGSAGPARVAKYGRSTGAFRDNGGRVRKGGSVGFRAPSSHEAAGLEDLDGRRVMPSTRRGQCMAAVSSRPGGREPRAVTVQNRVGMGRRGPLHIRGTTPSSAGSLGGASAARAGGAGAAEPGDPRTVVFSGIRPTDSMTANSATGARLTELARATFRRAAATYSSFDHAGAGGGAPN